MIIVLIGAPGAGKGTLAGSIKNKLNFLHLSTGDLLREEMKANTELGQEAKQFVENGALVPDELVTKLIEKKITTDSFDEKKYLLDGYPRTKKQAADLDQILKNNSKCVDMVLYLDANFSTVLQRLSGRRVCKKCGSLFHVTNMPPKKEGVCDQCGDVLYQRADDNEATITKRMDVYKQQTEPIIAYYEEQKKIERLNADQSAGEVHQSAFKIINEKENRN